MNTSLTPNDTVGRMLHTFNSTAYEIDDCNYETLSDYGFISGENIINSTKSLYFRTVSLQSIYNNPNHKLNDGSIEVLRDLHNGHGQITALSLKIEDCEYGDQFQINNGPIIMIGATQSYNIDGPLEITSLRFRPE